MEEEFDRGFCKRMLPFKAIVSAGSGELLWNHPRGWSILVLLALSWMSMKIHLTMILRKVKLFDWIVTEYLMWGFLNSGGCTKNFLGSLSGLWGLSDPGHSRIGPHERKIWYKYAQKSTLLKKIQTGTQL